MGIKVAVVGATGAVGREMLQTLEERSFPSDEIIALASSKSIGKEVSYGEDRSLKVQGLDSLLINLFLEREIRGWMSCLTRLELFT